MTSSAGVPAPAPLARGEPARVGQIDALRAVAMAAVIAQHCRILPFGWAGVWLFYVISGFVVTTSLTARPPGTSPIGRFYARRAARIMPIYCLYVTVGLVVSAVQIGHLEWPPYASLVLFYNNFAMSFGQGTFARFPVGHLWTISVEMQFYLVFGFLFYLAPRRVLKPILVAFLVLAPVLRGVVGEALLSAGVPPGRAAFAVYSLSLLHFDSFAAGALLALGGGEGWGAARPTRLLIAGAAAFGLYCGVYLLIAHQRGEHGFAMFRDIISGVLIGRGQEIWVYSAVAALAVGVVAVTERGVAPWSRWASSPALQAVGRASYGGYVYHLVCLNLVGWALSGVAPRHVERFGSHLALGERLLEKLGFGVALFALTLSATIVVSLLSYRFVERPIIARANRWLARAPAAEA